MYVDNLKAEGFTPERAKALSEAFDILHAAIASLDRGSMKQFFSLPMETRLANFAQSEDLVDMTSYYK